MLGAFGSHSSDMGKKLNGSLVLQFSVPHPAGISRLRGWCKICSTGRYGTLWPLGKSFPKPWESGCSSQECCFVLFSKTLLLLFLIFFTKHSFFLLNSDHCSWERPRSSHITWYIYLYISRSTNELRSKMHTPGLLSVHCACEWSMEKLQSSCEIFDRNLKWDPFIQVEVTKHQD